MRIASRRGRAVIVEGNLCADIANASNGAFSHRVDDLYEEWEGFLRWARAGAPKGDQPFEVSELDAPVQRPRQVFGIGLNYLDHAAESGVAVPTSPTVFTKFPTCLVGPTATVELPSTTVDWEVELVAVIGRTADRVSEDDAWAHVAGLTVGQDISERTVQLDGPVPQFSMGKSYRTFGPIGPWLVTPDELERPDDLELQCSVSGRVLQKGRTGEMVFSVSELISKISQICPMLPGDLLFTGTPPGVGMARKPQEFLQPGTILISEIEGIGKLANPVEAGPSHPQSAG
ncbi:fumarylacetoacetate hydrolase family protein [Mycobacterium sp. AZCC_0083]|uniref:fumarylacetoacetate hydrolase family protein n=1 Tax=Mycobacterium sp. AZCC_0083 TaxID=2735882 RepID=UPI0016077877|nr:fumarylacetoacetate hydrolase family protein [Mycobacterium sp. AZCC_0083]MBB5168500.1 2-keto-4-pentenoate hydratase/2-oxohepta-3-ene-1,7-dioic acid hydratase in catechol pathway [Mycobacterium sp. AZCC_0083]